jgi:hypothetical protein
VSVSNEVRCVGAGREEPAEASIDVNGFIACDAFSVGASTEFSSRNDLKLWSSRDVRLSPLPIDEIEAISY